jgi:PKD repeat protein
MEKCPPILLICLVLLSCSRLPDPDFSFHPDADLEAGETISFVNHSRHADSYKWEFGDGAVSYLPHPDYVYDSAGIFEVSLTAVNSEGSNSITRSLSIHEPTILGFLVYDSTSTRPLPEAEVWVYEDEAARDELLDPDYQGITNDSGKVEFRNVEAMVYHVWVSREEEGGSWTFRGYTLVLVANRVNNYTVPCQWTPAQEEATW